MELPPKIRNFFAAQGRIGGSAKTAKKVAAAKANAKLSDGRPRLLDAQKLRRARKMLAEGMTKPQVAKAIGVSWRTLHRALTRKR